MTVALAVSGAATQVSTSSIDASPSAAACSRPDRTRRAWADPVRPVPVAIRRRPSMSSARA